ncbi:hypothetical protein ACWCPM_19675 [Streptomyces sp. NPDC002309]
MKRSAVSLAAVLTACSGTDSTVAEPTATAPKATAPRPGQPTPAEQLAKLMVTDAEATGHTVTEPDTEYDFAKSPDEVTVTEPGCAPIVHVTNYLPLGEPDAFLRRLAKRDTSMSSTITLATYPAGKAEAAMQGLAEATASCEDGFTAKSAGATQPYDTVTGESAPAGGDESVATAFTFEYEGFPQTVRTQTFRFGDTIATYCTVDTGAFLNARPGEAKVPADLVKAQNAKLD